jgi:hypothetical protein
MDVYIPFQLKDEVARLLVANKRMEAQIENYAEDEGKAQVRIVLNYRNTLRIRPNKNNPVTTLW